MPSCRRVQLICFSQKNDSSRNVSWRKVLLLMYLSGALLFCSASTTALSLDYENQSSVRYQLSSSNVKVQSTLSNDESFKSTTVESQSTSFGEDISTKPFSEDLQPNSSVGLYECPTGPFGDLCSCFNYFVNCSYKGLESLPDVNLNIHSLDISYNFISSIDWNYFFLFQNMTIINLTGNALHNVTYPNETLPITELYIANCDLNYFNLTYFCQLQILHAAGNKLSFTTDSFHCMKDIEEINLSNNSLSTLPSNIFDGLERLKTLNLAGNPWSCDCSLVWMKLFIDSLIASNGILVDANNTLCNTKNQSSPVSFISRNIYDFSCHWAHPLYRQKKSADIQFDWQKICPQLKAVFKVMCGPSKATSCVYDFSSQSYSLVQYSQKKDAPSVSSCRDMCYESLAGYFVFNISQALCLCGDLNNAPLCADCSSSINTSLKLCDDSYVNIPGAMSVFYDFLISVSPSQPEVMSPVSFYLRGGPIIYDTFTWSFGDGVSAATNITNISHIYIYPGTFQVLLGLYSSKLELKKEMSLNINVISQSASVTLSCPSVVSTSEKINISASLSSPWRQSVIWFKEQLDVETKGSTPCAGILANKSCYVVVNQSASWEQAVTICQTNFINGHLAIIPDASVNLVLASQALRPLWIGLKAGGVQDQYYWSNGQLLSGYASWANTLTGEPCVSINSSGLWLSQSCLDKNFFVCQYDLWDLVCTSWGVSGTVPVFGNFLNYSSLIIGGSSRILDSYSIILPGTWFSDSDNILSWNFRTKSLDETTIVSLQIWRPVCDLGVLTKPGCGSQAALYSCQTDATQCSDNSTCEEGKFYCYITKTCQKLSVPCTCAGVHPAESINCQNMTISTNFMLIRALNVTVQPQSTLSHVDIPASLNWTVEAGDVIGFQADRLDIVECDNSTMSPWQHPLMIQKTKGWLNSMITIWRGNYELRNNVTCWINVVHARVKKSKVPENLSYLMVAGNYSFTLDTGLSKLLSCNITALDAVGSFTLIYPQPFCLNQSTVMVNVESEQFQVFVVKVDNGSDLSFRWTDSDEQVIPNTVSSSCPSSIANKITSCSYNTSLLANPYSFISKKFSTSVSTTIQVSVSNRVSVKNLRIMVHSFTAVTGLEFFHANCSDHTKCVIDLETGIPHTFIVSLKTGDNETRTYFVNGVNIKKPTVTSTGNLIYIFNTTGQFNLTVNVSNPLSWMTNNLTVLASAKGQFKSISFDNIQDKYPLDDICNISAVVPVTEGASLNISWSFGTNVFSSYLSSANSSIFFALNTFKNPGNVTVRLTLTDSFHDQITSTVTIFVYKPIKSLELVPCSNFVATMESFNMSVGIGNAVQNDSMYFGNITYLVDWGDGSDSQSWTVTELKMLMLHVFNVSRIYIVNVSVCSDFDKARALSESFSVTVQDTIMGLALTYDGPKHVSKEIIFTINYTSGTDVFFSLNYGDGSNATGFQNSSVFPYTYSNASVYEAQVIAKNLVGQATHSFTLFAYDEHLLQIIRLKFPQCVSVKTSVDISTEVAAQSPKNLDYFWLLGSGFVSNGTGIQKITTKFENIGNYNVSLTVRNTTSSNAHDLSRTICVQENISGVSVNFTNPVAFNQIKISENVTLTAIVALGSNLTFSWDVDNTSNVGSGQVFDLKVTQPRNYSLTLKVSNNISKGEKSIVVQVLSIISGLQIKCGQCFLNRYCKTLTNITMNAEVIYGSQEIYTWRLDNSTTYVQNKSYEHMFTAPGTYIVNVTSQNAVSKQSSTLTIVAQDEVSGVSINATPAIGNVNQRIMLKVNWTRGTDVQFDWNCDFVKLNGTDSVTFIFQSEGLHQCAVVLFNNISRVNHSLQVHILSSITNLSVNHSLISVQQSHILYASSGRSYDFFLTTNTYYMVSFEWNYTGTIRNSLHTGPTFTITFTDVESGNITLKATNELSTKSVTLPIEVQEEIRNLSISSNISYPFNTSSPLYVPVGESVLFCMSLMSGSNFLSQWYHNGALISLTNVSKDSVLLEFMSVGPSSIELHVSNAVSSRNKSVTVMALEAVSNVTIKVGGASNLPYFRTGSNLSLSVPTVRGSLPVYNWSIISQANGHIYMSTQSNISYIFKDADVYKIKLEVSNLLSNQTEEITLIAQGAITRLNMSFKNQITATGVNVTMSTVINLDSTNVSYTWNISGDVIQGETVIKTFDLPGVKNVLLSASNNVSNQTSMNFLYVLNPIVNLRIIDCSLPQEAQKSVSLKSTIDRGTNVTFRWTVQFKNKNTSISGQNITFVFLSEGVYTLYLTTINAVSNETVACSKKIYFPISQITLKLIDPNPDYVFQNQNVTFSVTGEHLWLAMYEWSIYSQNVSTLSSMKTFTALFPSVGNYTLSLNVSNEISHVLVHLNFTVKECLCQLPEVTVIGPSSRTYQRSRAIELEVNVDTKDCSLYLADHQWMVFQSDDCSNLTETNQIHLDNTSTTSLKLTILPRTLTPGFYCVRFVTSYLYTSVAEMTYFKINVTATAVKAIIIGGTSRTVAVGTEVCMDGSLSVNLDIKYEPLYMWQCIQLSSEGGGCFQQQRGKLFCYENFQPGKYKIILQIVGQETSLGSAEQLVIVLPDRSELPLASIVCESCTRSNNYRLSASQSVSLSASCEKCSCQPYFAWRVYEDQVQINPNRSQNPTGLSGPHLLLNKWGALRDNHNYTFLLDVSCEKDFSKNGSASLEMLANLPPSGRTCIFRPTEIVPLENQVTVYCSDWIDIDDPDTALVYSIYVVSENVLTNQNRSYLLYTGTSQSQSVYLSSYTGETIILKVMVSDQYGASALGGSKSIVLKPLSLPKNMTAIDYISEQTDTRLSAFIKQAKPMTILQFAIALGLSLNQESQREHGAVGIESLSEQKRSAVRDAIAICLSTSVPITTVADVQQMAYALRMLTDYSDEFLTKDSQLLIMMTLTKMHKVLSQALPTIESQEDIPVDDLAAVITNLLKAVNTPVYSSGWSSDKTITIDSFNTKFRNLTPEISMTLGTMEFHKIGLGEAHRKSVISAVVPFLEDIIVTSLRTTVIGGEGFDFEINEIKLKGQRCYAQDISTNNFFERIQFNLSSELLSRQKQKHDEVLQIWISYSQNPYTYGYDEPTYDYMPVQTISFHETNGSYITLRDLGDTDSVKLSMMSAGNASNLLGSEGVNSGIFYEPQKNLSYSSVNILPNKNVLWQISSTNFNIQKGVGVHIQLRIKFLPMDTNGTNTKGSTVTCYLGLNDTPSSSHYFQKLILSSQLMDSGTDHRLYTFFSNQLTTTDKLFVMATNDDRYHTVQLSVATYYSFCQYFNTTTQRWALDGCVARETSTAVNTFCQCNHLTSFGAAALAPIVDFDFADLANLDLTTNPVVFIAVAIIFCVYLIIAFICGYFDRMDLKRISRIPLCGRDGGYKYKITIVTGRSFGAGTSANVGLKLYGNQCKGQMRHLTKMGAFQRNCHDSFLVAFDTSLGEVTKMMIWHDNSGLSPSWYLSHVIVQDVQTKTKYTFIVNSWLSLEMEDGTIQKTVMVADDEQLKSFKHQFSTVFFATLAELHTWLSVSNRPDHSRFTRVQRATCCLTCTYLYMGVNAIWYGVFKTKSEAEISWNSFGWEEIIITLVSTIMVLPLLFGLSCLFKRTQYKESVLTQARRPSTAHTLEIDADIDLFSTSESSKTLTTLGDLEMAGIERESTTDSLPITTKLKRTVPMHARSNKIKNIDDSLNKKMKKELWSRDNILQNWPDTMPDWIQQEKAQTSALHNLSDTEMNNSAIKAKKTIMPKKSAGLNRNKLAEDIDDDFDHQLDQLSAEIVKDESRKKKTLLKKFSKKDVADDLFNSDDDWVYEDHEKFVKDSSKSKFPASCVGEDPGLLPHIESARKRFDSGDKFDISAFYKGKRQSIVSFSSKTKTISSEGRVRSMSLESQISNKKMSGCTLPPWCLYVSYAICMKLCLLSIILVLWYGYRFGASVAVKWLVSLCFSVFASILVVEPVKVVFVTVIFKVLKKDVIPDEDPSLLDITPVSEMNEQIKEVKFKPLGGFALLHAKEEGKKSQHLHTMLREAVMFMLMFALFLSVVYSNSNTRAVYHHHHNIQKKLYSSLKTGIDLSKIKSVPNFWQWSQSVMARVIHFRELDQSETFGILMGAAWLRQIRGEKVPCPVGLSTFPTSFRKLDTKRCVDVAPLDPPRDPYGVRWNIGSKNWTYSSSSELNMYSKFGKSLYYTGSGYIQKLGLTHNDTVTKLRQLETDQWIDNKTKAVFVEFMLYSAGVDLTTSGSVLIEFPITGGLLVSTSLQSEKLLRYVYGTIEPILVCQVIFLMFVIYLSVILFTTLRSEKLGFFLGLWNWIDFLICMLAWTNSGLYLACNLRATDNVNKFLTDSSDSAHLAQVVLMHAVYHYLHACLVFLFCLKVVRQVRYIRPLYKFYMTLSVSSGPLMGVFFIFIILLLSYAQLGYLIFGANIQDYSSFEQSLTALLGLMFGQAVQLTWILQSFPILTLIFFTSFCFIAYGMVMALSISILGWSYKRSKSQLYFKTTLEMRDYEMIDFMLHKFKLITGMIKPKPPFRRVKFADHQSTSCLSTLSSSESNQSFQRFQTSGLSKKKNNPLTYNPVSNLNRSWNKVLSLIEKVEALEFCEDESTRRLKTVIEAWKSVQEKSRIQSVQKKCLPREKVEPHCKTWTKVQNHFFENREVDYTHLMMNQLEKCNSEDVSEC
ncbi:polycystin-1 [Biomphalaria pfeifferi]|uniref:Polycystin-1 n=1 Tax=Biomphalaria pfeifferi TaxID=112525 RepID=A0AAD8B4Q2_BIOPF|nr:polycystin-1 [Biomphalaria pfeifferi]